MRTAVVFVGILLSLLASGCRVTDKAISTAKVAAAGNDRYSAISAELLSGKTDGKNGPAVSKEDLAKTPAPVKELLKKLLSALHTNRFAWHSVLFQLNEGMDPAEMGLEPLALPQASDEGILEREEDFQPQPNEPF